MYILCVSAVETFCLAFKFHSEFSCAFGVGVFRISS